MCEWVKSRDAGIAKWPEFIKNIVEVLIEATIENDLIRDILIAMFFVKSIKIIFRNDVCSFLNLRHLLLYLVGVVLLIVRRKTI